MSAIVGYGGSVGSLVGVKRWRINDSVKVVDVTSFSSSGKREVKAGIEQWEGEFEANEKPSYATGTIVTATFSTGSAGGGSATTYTGSVLINAINPETPYDDQVIWRVSFTGNGALS